MRGKTTLGPFLSTRKVGIPGKAENKGLNTGDISYGKKNPLDLGGL